MKIKNYTLIDQAYIGELKSTAYILDHDQTKARILYLENDDDIMTFSIGFKTPPEDSTGVAHILEHSVLSGSRKYKTKEPFMDMVNSSMQTFLNAMTFPDKTIYPVASRNEKDFFNLMDVYLDAVFYPAIYEEERIFKQEGIHLEMEDMESPIVYNGVVYNEMRGNYSDPEGQVLEVLAHQLHPDSSYAHDSGGNPYDIVDLTYQELLDFHSRYYHPSNSYIFLNGDMDIERVLAYIDDEYLSNFNYQDPKADISLGQRFEKSRRVDISYSVGQGDDTDKKSYLVYGVDLGLSTSVEDSILADVLADILMDSPSSILKAKLLDSQIGEDYYSYKSSSLPLDLYFVAKNADPKFLDDFVNIIESELKKAIDEGINKDLLEASINIREFAYKDMGTNRGVYLNIMALGSWLYGASPIEGLSFKKAFDSIKEKSKESYLEDFIQERILDNPQKIILLAQPEPGLFAQKDQVLRDRLDRLKDQMSEEEKADLLAATQDLFAYQLEDDSPEAKATIPQLELKDVSPGVKDLNIQVDEESFPKIFVDEYTNDIYYTTASFDLKVLEEGDLAYAGLVLDMLGLLDTQDHSYQDLQTLMDIHTGGINFFSAGVENYKDQTYFLEARLSARALPDKIDMAHRLIEEIIRKTKFDDTKRIKDLITMRRSSYEGSIEQAGHRNISNELQAKLNDLAYYSNLLSGNGYYFFLKEIEKDFDDKSQEIIGKLKEVYEKIFNQAMAISIGGDRAWYDKGLAFYESLRKKLGSFPQVLKDPSLDRSSIALKSSSNVVYVGEAYDLSPLGIDYSGDMAVLAKVLGGGYLHTNIRAKGGAYGSTISISIGGLVSLASYRDPNLDATYKVYDQMADSLRSMDLSSRELTNYIIATMNSFDPPRSPSSYTGLALNRYKSATGPKDIEVYKDQALKTKLEDLKAYADVIDQAREARVYGTLGSRDIIDSSQVEFDKEIDISKY